MDVEGSDRSIHTLNARDHIMLEVVREHFNLSPEQVYFEIEALWLQTVSELKKKGISYDALKTALVPDRIRREIALVFDTTRIESSWYGLEVFRQLLPLFDLKSNHSVLCGDYLPRAGQGERQYEAFKASVELRRSVDYQHPSQFFIVYINNLSDAMVKTIDDGLAHYEPYVGVAEMTYRSDFKTYLSTMLVNSFIKHGKIILQGHEPDAPPEENVNMCGYPFEKYGYQCRSISDDLVGVLLSFKIERPVFAGFESDTEFALNAVSKLVSPLQDFEVEVQEAKLAYLKSDKAGSMQRAGLDAIGSSELAGIIKSKINASYIYNLAYSAVHRVTKFNLIIELPSETGPTRLLAAIEYKPTEKRLRLITLY